MWTFLVTTIVTALGVALPAGLPAAPAPAALADLPRGEAPGVGYVADGTWHGPQGRRVSIPDRHGVSAVTAYDGGFLVTDTRFFEGSVGLARVDAAGRVVERWSTSGLPAVADDGRVAWSSFVPPETGLAPRASVHVDGTTVPWPDPGVFSAAGFAGGSVVASGYRGTFLVAPDGTRTRVPGLLTAYDATDRWVAGDLRRGSGLVSVATGELRWRASGQGHSFSPSGRRVAVAERSWVVVRRTSDGRVLWRQPVRGYPGPLVWEDARHVLAVVVQGERSAVVRLGRDGAERATRVRDHRFQRPGFVLTTR